MFLLISIKINLILKKCIIYKMIYNSVVVGNERKVFRC